MSTDYESHNIAEEHLLSSEQTVGHGMFGHNCSTHPQSRCSEITKRYSGFLNKPPLAALRTPANNCHAPTVTLARPSDAHDVQASPRGAVVWIPDANHAIRFNVSRAFQTPNILEYFVSVPAGAPADFSILGPF